MRHTKMCQFLGHPVYHILNKIQRTPDKYQPQVRFVSQLPKWQRIVCNWWDNSGHWRV